jgi:hypothetical protein
MGRARAIVAICLGLAACTGGVPERRAPRPQLPNRLTNESPQTRVCLANLGQLANFQSVPDRDFGEGCYIFSSVKLTGTGVPVSNLGPMTCSLAATFAGWVRSGVMPAARLYLGSDLARVETFGSYSCRNINGRQSGNRSEHATANAVDVSGYVLADGRRITIKQARDSNDPAVKSFLSAIHTSACKRFKTVLSPDYNALHADHFHLDMGRGPFCR